MVFFTRRPQSIDVKLNPHRIFNDCPKFLIIEPNLILNSNKFHRIRPNMKQTLNELYKVEPN